MIKRTVECTCDKCGYKSDKEQEFTKVKLEELFWINPMFLCSDSISIYDGENEKDKCDALLCKDCVALLKEWLVNM